MATNCRRNRIQPGHPAGIQLNQAALSGKNLHRQLSAVFSGHRSLDTFDKIEIDCRRSQTALRSSEHLLRSPADVLV